MYLPAVFKESDVAEIHAAIRSAGLADLITNGPSGMIGTPLPLFLDPSEGEHGVLYGHVSKGNPQWREGSGEALAMFRGPDAYVSPSWYATKTETGKVVPTWNYVAVHAYGPVEFFHDADRLLEAVTRLTRIYENGRDHAWAVSDAPPDFIQSQLKGIVGVRMPITRLEGKRKMSQNRTADDRAGVIEGLLASPDPKDRDVAELMKV